MQERRDVPRWRIDKDVTITCEGSPDPVWGQVRDINLKGMQLSLAGYLPESWPVRMQVAIDQELKFSVEAQIPWRRSVLGEHRYGVSFQGIQDVDRERIYEYVSTRCAEQFLQHWWE